MREGVLHERSVLAYQDVLDVVWMGQEVNRVAAYLVVDDVTMGCEHLDEVIERGAA